MLTEQRISEKASTETVTGLKWWNDRLLSFTTTRAPEYSFAAGQYARLGLRDETGIIWRAYSMVSAPAENSLEFYGVIVPGGLFTSRLKRIQPGAEVLVERQPYGFMTVDRFEDGEDLWLLSTGTGVGPYISILREGTAWRRFRNLVLVHGVRQADEFVYHDELERMRQAPPGPARLQVVRAVTRDQAPGALQGRITTLLADGELERATGLTVDASRSRLMMCGNPEMIEDMRGILHGRGLRPQRRLAPGQFVTENYW
ncbi:ferredoxin--NADP reductase [Noviherbaspirillum aridicola]|uniref:ferredoxin--NADP(+) reductase n=1 Tax=Noviherbaspirillum aridicola TaxID=2849687 RepID=A0ABQ4Q458_9BURK|nr:ferredoxin--NADP reductase [Noviherbaspirillum aridicola]GIZ51580.1 ferredoxin--NADP(+) reductase [Noviherbaspirillum aridicola]